MISGLDPIRCERNPLRRSFFLALVLVVAILGAAGPTAAQYRVAFVEPPWPGGWSGGASSSGEVTVWRQSTAAAATANVALVWTSGISPDASTSELEHAFSGASEIGSAVASFGPGTREVQITLDTEQLTAPQNIPYVMWLIVDGVVARALDGGLETRDLWVVYFSPGYAGPLTQVDGVGVLTTTTTSATFAGGITLWPEGAYSQWRTSYMYRLLFGGPPLTGLHDFEDGVVFFEQSMPISVSLPAPWEWPSGHRNLSVELGRYDAAGVPIAPEDGEFDASDTSWTVLVGCADLAAPASLAADPQGSGTFPITWNRVSGADGYLLRVTRGVGAELFEVAGTSYSYDFSAGSSYEIGVRAYAECSSGMRSYGGKSEIEVVAGGPPQVSFEYTVDDYLPGTGFTVHFTDRSQGADPGSFTWAWDFGDGATSSTQNPEHTYAQGGCYTVSLTMTNSYGPASHSTMMSTPVAGVSFDWVRVDGGDLVRFAATAVGEATGNFVWGWDFDDSGTQQGEGRVVTYGFTGPGMYEVTVRGVHCSGEVAETLRRVPATLETDTTVGEELANGGSSFKHFIPAAARAPGAGGANWASDMAILSPSGSAAEVRLYLLGGGNNADSPGRRLPIAVDASVKLEDFFGIFAVEAATGGVLVVSDDLLVITSRTYNTDPAGTFGQFIPAVPLLGAVRETEEGRLIQLTQDGRAGVGGLRSNIGVLNVTDQPLQASAQLFDDDGDDLGSVNRTLPPYAFYQWNLVLGDVDSIDGAYALVRGNRGVGGVEGAGDNAFFTYASVVDNLTGDPVYIEPPRLLNPSRQGYLPVAAHAQGIGSFWQTDLEVHNPGPDRARFRLDLLETGADNSDPQVSGPQSLDEGESRRYSDVLGTWFSYEGTAAIRVRVLEGQVVATSRTYTPRADGNGTYGQYIPCYPRFEGIHVDDMAFIPQLASNSEFRTNIGFVNLNSGEVPVTIELFDGDGYRVGSTYRRTAKAWEHVQVNGIFDRQGASDVDNGYATVRPGAAPATGPEHPILLAYASVVDNRSADPVYIPAISLLPVADFSWQPESPSPGEQVYFTDRSRGYPTEWSWSFGAPSTGSSQRDPVHVFTGPGNYLVTLGAANPAGSTEAWAEVHVTACTSAVSIDPATLPDGAIDIWYEQTLSASGGFGGPYTFSVVSGALPTGLGLADATYGTVDIQGTATVLGTYSFVVAASDRDGCRGLQAFEIAVSRSNLGSGLVSYWDFDNGEGSTVADHIGVNHGAMRNMSSATAWGDGKFGSCLAFDGSDDHVNFGTDGSLDVREAMTVAAWVSPETAREIRVVFSKDDGVTDERESWQLFTSHILNQNANHQGSPQAMVQVSGPGGDQVIRIDAFSPLALGEWHHVAMTYASEEGMFRLYVDGVEANSAQDQSRRPIVVSGSPLVAGARGDGVNWFLGKIDDAALWSRALTGSEIAQIWNGGTGASIAELIDD